ncbi:MAG: EAL domain-containing protein [Gammaproteobacteria bacterium]|nr:EAL domain-containing protein [Gammaproteobacteria bacterium]
MSSLRFRIFLLFCALLLLAESIILATIYISMREQVDRNLHRQLQVGREVFLAQFESRQQHLETHSRVIGRDYGLLSTLNDDPQSLTVALDNHRNRVGADLAIITDTDGRTLADTGRPGTVKSSFNANSSVEASADGSRFLRHGGQNYQLVASPLLAPNPVGRLYLGFVVDEELAEEFRSITGLDVSFVSVGEDRSVVASTMEASEHELLADRASSMIGQADVVELHGNRFVTLAVPLAAGDERRGMLAVLQVSRSEALAAYRPWWQGIAEVSILVLVAGFAGAWFLARGIVRPVRLLSAQAESIAEGDYGREISIADRAAHGGEIGELVESFRRMQSAIAEREESIRYNAYHDATTGLINRHRLELLVDQRLSEGAVDRKRLAVVTIGLNGFREINETLGYHVGDRLLRSFAIWLDEAMEGRGVAARLGGDEFGLLLEDVSVVSLERELDKLVGGMDHPFHEEGLTLHIAFTMGVAIHPEHGRDAAMLLRHADAARFSARKKRISYEIFSGSRDRYSLLRISLLGELQAAMNRGDICLYFQPKLDLDNDQVHEVEALLRWNHPTYGSIPPRDFVPMIEHTGNIHMVTMWVIEQALERMAGWSEQGLDMDVAVNISAHDFQHEGLVEGIRDSLSKSGISAGRLKLELTESAVVEEELRVLETLKRLHELGVTLSIDDYGTGYSSLAQLKKLPFDELKIDKSFVLDLDRNPDDEIIIRSTIELGHLMGMTVCAEGVESDESLELLRRLSCERAQGFQIARPMPAAELPDWISQRTDGSRGQRA